MAPFASRWLSGSWVLTVAIELVLSWQVETFWLLVEALRAWHFKQMVAGGQRE